MPILKGATTFARFRVDADDEKRNWKRVIGPGLKGRAFEPLDRDGDVDRIAGFAELHDQDAREFSVGTLYFGEWVLFTWRVDEFRIPSQTVKAELERWKKEFEKEHGRPPGRREKNEAKLAVRAQLRKRAPIVTRTFDVSWILDQGTLQIWAASRKAVDEVQDAIEQACKVKLVPLVPVVVAEALGISDKALQPTPALSLPDEKEVARGEA